MGKKRKAQLQRSLQNTSTKKNDFLNKTIMLMIIIVMLTTIFTFSFYMYTLKTVQDNLQLQQARQEEQQQAQGKVTLQIIEPPPEEKALYEHEKNTE